MSEKSLREILEDMDPERALHVQKIANMIREEALHDVKAHAKKYFRDGALVGSLLTIIACYVLKFFGVL